MKLNGTHPLIVHADDVNILCRSVQTTRKNTEGLIVASKETGLEINAEKTKYMVMSRNHNAGQIDTTNIDNKSFEMVEQLKYFGTNLTYKISIWEKNKNRWKMENAYYHLVQNLLSSSFLSKNIKIKKYGTIILPVVLYGYETWSLTVMEKLRLKVLEKRLLRRIFGPKTDEIAKKWRRLLNEELNELYLLPKIIQII